MIYKKFFPIQVKEGWRVNNKIFCVYFVDWVTIVSKKK